MRWRTGKGILLSGVEISLDVLENAYQMVLDNSKASLNRDDIKDQLLSNLIKNNVVDIYGHGAVAQNKHMLNIDGIECPTREVLKDTADCYDDPIVVRLFSCYAGTAKVDISVFKPGSILFTYGDDEHPLSDYLSTNIINTSNQNKTSENPIIDFLNQLFLNVSQTATISIKAEPGKEDFHFTFRAPRHILTKPEEIIRFYELFRSEFIRQYNAFAALNNSLDLDPIDRADLVDLNKEGAKDWLSKHLLYLIACNQQQLMEILKDQDSFKELISTQSIDNSTLLLAAITSNNNGLCKLLIDSGVKFNNLGKEPIIQLLHNAIKSNDLDLTKWLLENVVNTKKLAKEEMAELLLNATKGNKHELTNLLIERCSNISEVLLHMQQTYADKPFDEQNDFCATLVKVVDHKLQDKQFIADLKIGKATIASEMAEMLKHLLPLKFVIENENLSALKRICDKVLEHDWHNGLAILVEDLKPSLPKVASTPKKPVGSYMERVAKGRNEDPNQLGLL